MKTLKDFNFKNKRVLLRCDFNVPFDEKGLIRDDFRIKQSLPTIEYLKKKGAKIILMSHLGRPNKNQKYSLKPIGLRLEKLLEQKVKFLDKCLGKKIEKEIEKMKPGEIILLENLRFHKEEEENSANFAKELSKLGDIYINDAFSVCHRSHASIVLLPKYLPSGAGLLLEKEIKVLINLMESPEKPLLAIIGGKKVETKVKLIDKISEISDFVLIGGLIKKEIEQKKIKLKNPQKIISPVDDILTFDIGPKTIEHFKEKIFQAKTIFWNGPLGMTEKEEFTKGSKEIAKAIIESGA
ncbi:MAG: phosphoglycerate kinase, partial [bacterium]|nr:phosphoglycerate kinase [bacterium]